MSVVASFTVSLQRRRTTDQHEKLLTSPFHNGIKNHTRHTQKSGKWYIYNNQNSVLSVVKLYSATQMLTRFMSLSANG